MSIYSLEQDKTARLKMAIALSSVLGLSSALQQRERDEYRNKPGSVLAATAGSAFALLLLFAAVSAHAREQKPFPARAQSSAAPPDPTRPAQQAQAIGLGQCAPILNLMGSQTLTQAYDLQSGWSRTDPTHHVFQSVAAMTNPANVPPDGVTALVAAPVTAGGCDGVAVQVFPLAADCQAAQKVMLKTGQLLAPMLNTRIMLDARGNRVILLPGYAHTCIAISVDSRFGTH